MKKNAKSQDLLVSDEELIGQYIAEDLVNMKTGEIHAEAGEEITEDLIVKLRSLSYKKLPILDIDHINIGAFLRNTLAADKNSNQEEALNDIYRVMRPGEPPTPETAGACSTVCFSTANAMISRRLVA